MSIYFWKTKIRFRLCPVSSLRYLSVHKSLMSALADLYVTLQALAASSTFVYGFSNNLCIKTMAVALLLPYLARMSSSISSLNLIICERVSTAIVAVCSTHRNISCISQRDTANPVLARSKLSRHFVLTTNAVQ